MVTFSMILSNPSPRFQGHDNLNINLKIVQNRARVTTAYQYKVVYDLSIGAIFNDLNDPRTQILRYVNIRCW